MVSIEEGLTTLKNDFERLNRRINIDKCSTFMNLMDVVDMQVSSCNKYLYVLLKNIRISVISISEKQRIIEIDPGFTIKSFTESNNKLFISGTGLKVYKSFNLFKQILQTIDIRSISIGAGCLFCLSATNLFKIDEETLEKQEEIAYRGKSVVSNTKIVATLGLGILVNIYNYDLTLIETVSLKEKYIRILLTHTGILIAGGNSATIELYECSKKRAYSDYKNINGKVISSFAITEDSNYLAAFDKSVGIYSIKDRVNEANIDVGLKKFTMATQKKLTTCMCFSKNGNLLFLYINSAIITVSMCESYNIGKIFELPSEIRSLEYRGMLIINHDSLSTYNLAEGTIDSSISQLGFLTSDGVYAINDSKVLVGGVARNDVVHTGPIVNIEYRNGCVITYDSMKKANVIGKNWVFPVQVPDGGIVVGAANGLAFILNGNKVSIWQNEICIKEKSFEGSFVMYNRSAHFVIVADWEVQVFSTNNYDSYIPIACPAQTDPPIYFSISEDDLYLYIATCSSLTLWSLYDFLYLGKIDYQNISHIAISPTNIFIGAKNMLQVFTNPLNKEENAALLIPEKYSIKYWSALKTISGNPKVDKYDRCLNDCIIIPMCYNILHIFTHQLNTQGVKRALKEGCAFIRSNRKKSPIKIASEQKTNNIIDYFLKSFSIFLENDPNTLYRTEDDLISLNQIGSYKLLFLYNSMFVVPNQKLAKFGKPVRKGQHILVKPQNYINEEDFVKKSKASSTKGNIFEHNFALEFRVSALRLPLTLGSDNSIAFLNSLTYCENQDILATPIIKSILTYKWEIVYYWVLIQGILVTTLLLLLSFYIIKDRNSSKLFLAIQFINFMFLIYETMQASVGFRRYIRNFWNFMDFLRIIFILLLFFQESFSKDIEILLMSYIIIVTWTKAISYFRIYQPTRYLIYMIKECAKDTIPFLVILLYLTITFAITFHNFSSTSEAVHMTFGEAWTHSYLLNFNSFQTDSYDNIQWVLFIIATLINPLVLMNMIIALLGNTYGRVKENAVVADLLELAEMIIETESILIWRRSNNDKDYVQICASAEKIEDNEIKSFGAQVKKISTVIPQIKERLSMMVKNNENGCRHLENILRKEFEKFDEDLKKLEISMQDDYDFLKSEFTSSLIK